MTENEKNLLLILKEIFHPGKKLPELCQPVDWNAVLECAEKQNLLPLVYDAADAYADFGEFVKEKKPAFFSSAVSTATKQIRRNKAFLDLYAEFLKEGIAPITMKGIVCRQLYGEKGVLRPSGDEDILIEKKDFDKAVAILARCGYVTRDMPDNALELVQEVTFHSRERGLTIEMHLNPFGTWNEYNVKMNSRFLHVFDSDERIDVQGVSVRTMTPTDHLLFLVFHNFKHFIAGGFGVRLLADELLFMEKYYERIDWDRVKEALRDVRAEKFFSDTIVLGNCYLGFDLPHGEKEMCPHELMEDILRMGTFGNTTKEDKAAGKFVKIAVQQSGEGGEKTRKFGSYFRMLFPSWQSWCARLPYLKDKPWMLPAEWFKRVGRYVRKETPTGTLSQVEESYKTAEHRIELMKKYNIV